MEPHIFLLCSCCFLQIALLCELLGQMRAVNALNCHFLTAPSKRLSTPNPFGDYYCTRYGLLWWLCCCCCCCQVASVVSDSVRPHRRQPTRLPRPWDSPGKSTGVGCHCLPQCMKVKSESEVAQSCLTVSHPMDCSPPGPSVHGGFQTRVLEWGAIAFSALVAQMVKNLPAMQETLVRSLGQEDSLEKVKVKGKSLSRVRLFATPWTAAYQVPPSMEFSRQEYWSGLPFPSPVELPDPGIEPGSPTL